MDALERGPIVGGAASRGHHGPGCRLMIRRRNRPTCKLETKSSRCHEVEDRQKRLQSGAEQAMSPS